jgi:hypothetical protein
VASVLGFSVESKSRQSAKSIQCVNRLQVFSSVHVYIFSFVMLASC